jgi:hypothetical protein
MRRLVPLAGLLALLVSAAGAAARTHTPLAARLAGCTTGEGVAERAATFTASMPALPGARRLWMRFTLEVRVPPDGGYARVPLDTWHRWERAEPGRPGFIYTKRVEGLTGPAVYRAVVRFRWADADGHVLRRARLVTRGCRQPGPPGDTAPAAAATSPPQPGPTTSASASAPTGRAAGAPRTAASASTQDSS